MSSSQDVLDADEARRRLYDVMRQDLSFEEKAERALALGRQYFGVENGHVTRIDPETNYWEAIASTDPPDGAFPPGQTLDLRTTYCRRTIQEESPIAVHDALEAGWGDDPAFETHELRCYHGTTLTVDDELYGTVCFVSMDSRDEPFSDTETMFAELVARMLGHTLERTHGEADLNARERLIGVLNRVLRHNLRNDLNVVRAHAETLQEPDSEPEGDPAGTIISTVDELLAISGSARQLETVMTEETDGRDVDVAALVERLADTIEREYPDASVAIESTPASSVQVPGRLEVALQELLENAAKHAGTAPNVGVAVTTRGDSIRVTVTDDGPGLPSQERAVLREGVETPLVHGSGLGLWLVYWVVTGHGGAITTTVTDSGTSVTVEIPRSPVVFRERHM